MKAIQKNAHQVRIDRYCAIVDWASKRYTKNGLLVVSIGGVPTTYSRIEKSAWNKYRASEFIFLSA